MLSLPTGMPMRQRSFTSIQFLQISLLVLFVLQSASFTKAHGGHGHDTHFLESPENQAAPIDTLLRLHIITESLIWGIIFPIGMILGLSRSRYHVPMQVTAVVVSIGGMQLARKHGGRQFSHANHGNFAPWLFWIMIIQAGIGIYLKMHIMEGTNVRWAIVKVHGLLGRLFPVIGYTQMVLGVILGLVSCFLLFLGSPLLAGLEGAWTPPPHVLHLSVPLTPLIYFRNGLPQDICGKDHLGECLVMMLDVLD